MKVVKKVYNNNVVLVINEKGHEEIIMGKGIGFNLRAKETFDEAKLSIDKTFVVEDEQSINNLPDILNTIDYSDIELASDIIKQGEKVLGYKCSTSILLTLSDHISFMLQRARQNAFFNAPLEWDIKMLYPSEYEYSLKAVELMRERTGIKIPDQEAAFIALHFINSHYDNRDMQETVFITKVIQNVVNIASYHYGRPFDRSSYNFSRFVTHMRYFVRRQVRGEDLSADSSILGAVSKKYINDYQCALKIKSFLEKEYKWQLSSSEVLYLTLYLNRLSTN
ncbi:PRD domain-containing protein [Lacticaseibacillus paracasei]|uniref:PRD domain-containing protein n=1 Tax=Lacticaseibacillus paracasei TaxID=1597 RepID=UPI00189AEB08|nr:PRD domain-containing protein [Lacticaseibacillus paracasei]